MRLITYLLAAALLWAVASTGPATPVDPGAAATPAAARPAPPAAR